MLLNCLKRYSDHIIEYFAVYDANHEIKHKNLAKLESKRGPFFTQYNLNMKNLAAV